MQDQVSLVRYFADVRKLVTMCYKLSLEKQELSNQIQNNKNKKIKFNQSRTQKFADQINDQSSNSDSDSKSILKQKKPNQQIQNLQTKKTRSQNKINELTKEKSNLKPKEIWPCQHCDRQYRHLTSLKRHVQTDHQLNNNNNNNVFQVDP